MKQALVIAALSIEGDTSQKKKSMYQKHHIHFNQMLPIYRINQRSLSSGWPYNIIYLFIHLVT